MMGNCKDLLTVPFTKALSPEEKKYLDSICEGMDRQIQLVAEWLASEEAAQIHNMTQQQIDRFFETSGIRQQLDTLIEYNASNSEDFINEFYRIGAGLGFAEIGRTLAFTPADKEALYRLSNYNFDLVRNLNNHLRDGIREVIFNAVASGEGHNVTVRRLRELPLEPLGNISPRTRAEMIARTEQARAANTGTLQAYADYGVEHVEIITAGDSVVCDYCRTLEDGNPYPLTLAMKYLPAHPNCRCAYASVVETLSDVPVDNPIVIDMIENVNEPLPASVGWNRY